MRTMKTALKAMVLLLMLAPAMMLSSCSDVDDGSYVDPIKITEKVNGQWAVNSVTQTDVAAGKDLVLTDKLGFSTFAINLGANGDYQITGDAPKLIPTSGTWSLDNNFVKSDGSAAQILLNGEPALTITKTPGNTRELEFRVTHYNEGEAYVNYTYNLYDPNEVVEEPAEE